MHLVEEGSDLSNSALPDCVCMCQLFSIPLLNCVSLCYAHPSAASKCCPCHMLPSLYQYGVRELPSALPQEAEQKGRPETI